MKDQITQRFQQVLSYFSVFVTALFILSLASCNHPNAESENYQGSQKGDDKSLTTITSVADLSTYRVGYSTPSLNAPFYVALMNNIKARTEAYGMTFVSADGQADISKQITSIEDLVASGISALIVNPLDPKALVPTINAASKQGIPVFIVDSYVDPKAKYVCAIQAENHGNGFLIGEWVADQMRDEAIKAAIISGNQGNPIGQKKRLGFAMGFVEGQLRSKGHADVSIVSQGWGQWSNDGGLSAMEDILVAHSDINLLVAENDAMAMGALKAIKESGKSEQILVVGFDGQKEAYELIMREEYDATALNSPSELGQLVTESVVKYLNGERALDKVIYTTPAIITADNVEDYYDEKAIF